MRTLFILLIFAAQILFAQTIAYTSFEEATATGTKYTDTGDAATDHALINNPGEPDVNFVSTGGEMGFSSYYYNTENGTGLTDGDYVGVSNYTGAVGAFTDGSQGFQLSDVDGYMVVTFDSVDVSAYPSVQVSLDYFVNDDSWETDPMDFLRIWVVLDGTEEKDIVNTQPEDIDNLGIEGAWMTANGLFAGHQKLTLKIGLQSNGSFEAVYFDNIQIAVGGSANIDPQIADVGRSTLVPAATEDVTDTVRAYDESAVASVEFNYSVNDGAVTTLAMTDLGMDSLYVATIPASAYNDGDRVVFWSTVTDDSGAVVSTDKVGFFAGTTPIASLKQSAANQTLAYEGYYARTTGVATVGSDVFSTSSLSIYIQDENYGAIAVHKSGEITTITQGNSYTITGMVSQYNGLAQLQPENVFTDVVDNGAATMPEAFATDLTTLLSGAESFEGLLVKVTGADTVSDGSTWPEAGKDANITITDDAGAHTVTLRVDKDTDIDDNSEPTWPQNITGIFSQYDYSSPYTDGYQLIPRSMADFEDATAIDDDASHMPVTLKLYQAYPNPFNPSTTIRFDVPAKLAGDAGFELAVFNNLGQKVKVLSTQAQAGSNVVTWNGLNEQNQSVSTGIYYAILKIAAHTQSVKLLLLK